MGWLHSICRKKLDSALEQRKIRELELVGHPDLKMSGTLFCGCSEVIYFNISWDMLQKDSIGFQHIIAQKVIRTVQFFILVDANVKPITDELEKEFANKNYSVMLGGSWLPGEFCLLTKQEFEDRIGMIPMFPVLDNGSPTASIMGGWLLSIPQASKHKEIVWELITIILKPEILISQC